MSGRQWRRGVSAAVLAAFVGTGGAAVAEAQQGTAAVGPGLQQQFTTLDRNGDNRLDRSELVAAQDTTFSDLDADGDGRITADEAASGGTAAYPMGSWMTDRGAAPGAVPAQRGARGTGPGYGPGYGPGMGPGPQMGRGPGYGMGPGPQTGPGPGYGMGPGPGMGPGSGMGPGMMQGPQGRGFSAMDLDRDGVVTRQEFNARHRTMMDAFDANRDGYVSPDEFADTMPMWRQR